MPRYKEMHNSHRWKDVSYHGSPSYVCVFCGCDDWHEPAALPCPKREECLAKETAKKEQEEKWEYERLKKDRARWEYLRRKYEKEPTLD
jgi:hypothetical protein